MSDTEPKVIPGVFSMTLLDTLDELKTQYDVLEALNKKIVSKHNMKDYPGEFGVMLFRMFYNKTKTFCQMASLMGWLNPEEYSSMNFPNVVGFRELEREAYKLAILTDEVIGEDTIPEDKVNILKEKCYHVQTLHSSLITDSITKVNDKLESVFEYDFGFFY